MIYTGSPVDLQAGSTSSSSSPETEKSPYYNRGYHGYYHDDQGSYYYPGATLRQQTIISNTYHIGGTPFNPYNFPAGTQLDSIPAIHQPPTGLPPTGLHQPPVGLHQPPTGLQIHQQATTHDLQPNQTPHHQLPRPVTQLHPADSSTDLEPCTKPVPHHDQRHHQDQGHHQDQTVGGGKMRTKRTEYTATDLKTLEDAFAVSDFARGARRDELAKQLGVRPRSITIWFQNKRAKIRAQRAQIDLLKKAAETGIVQSSEEIADYR